MSASYAHLIEPVAALAHQAAVAILEVYGEQFTVDIKADRSPLTAADRRAHEILSHGLAALDPALPVLSEESAAAPWQERRHWQRYWLVDPLDGTREFIQRNGEFTVNVALIEHGVPVLGVVHVPVTALSYRGALGSGAHCHGADGSVQALTVTPYAGGPLRVVASRSHADDTTRAFLERIGPHEVVSMGSSLKICLVAQGRADLYPRFGPTSEWDTAAADGVLRAAGGQLTRLDLTPLRYNAKESLLNPPFLAFGAGKRDWAAALPAQD